jgi:hypothetical protein
MIRNSKTGIDGKRGILWLSMAQERTGGTDLDLRGVIERLSCGSLGEAAKQQGRSQDKYS